MCGIAGIWNLDARPVDRGELARFRDTLAHRGPDGAGEWFDDAAGVGLGHRRLSILDLSSEGAQPMATPDGNLIITFNGEIYNFVELKAELEAKGHRFRSTSDTEVILYAYREWGTDMFRRFNGMWAFALYDKPARRMIFSRDRFGVKPMFYRVNGSQLAFSSELKSFRELEGSLRLDMESASVFMRAPFSLEGTERTLLEGVRRLPHGHFAVVTPSGVTVKRWWNTIDNLRPVPTTEAQQAEEFADIFKDAIRLRMRSDVPIGTCLSGGFDSTAILCMLKELGARTGGNDRAAADWQHAFVASFPGAGNDERPQAEEALRYAGISGQFTEVSQEDALADIDQVLCDADDTVINVPTALWLIYRAVRRANIKVTIDGHGADELLGGYRRGWETHLVNAPSFLGSPIENGRLIGQYLGDGGPLGGLPFALLRNHPSLSKYALAAREWRQQPFFRKLYRGAAMIRPEMPFAPVDEFTPFATNDQFPEHWAPIDRELYGMMHATVLPTILRNFDRVSMANSVEIRAPFIDWRLVTYCFSLPSSQRLGGGLTKRIARAAMRGRMPESIRSAKSKIGFNSPLPEWLRGPLGPWAHSLLNTLPREHQLVDLPRVRALLGRTENGGELLPWRQAEAIWAPLHLLWFEQHFTKKGGGSGKAAPVKAVVAA